MKPIQFYTAGTPNGQKVSIMLEEIKALNPSFEYETHAIDIMKNTQKEDWFLKMNPNGRIPTILDPNNTATDQNGFAVMESMSIMLYLEYQFEEIIFDRRLIIELTL
uniref:Glutathione s-transferase n=1 Tax=Melanopsichium pennsylvanicum 4 TaxID=1398559 RepID=A0A077QTD8_9BASI|nr:glutathione s-transferase [Melanopsichium pennsylvanicum 4]